LLAYTKIHIQQALLDSSLPDNEYMSKIVETAFPEPVRKKYAKAMKAHKLHRDIMATQLSNQIVNEMGITFMYRLQIETGASIENIAKAYTIASHIFNTRELHKTIDSLNFEIPLSVQYETFFHIRNLINLASRWFLRGGRMNDKIESIIAFYAARVQKLENVIPTLMGGLTEQYLKSITEEFMQHGLSKELAHRVATCRAIYTALNIIEVSSTCHFDLVKTAEIYFAAGERIGLLWFRDQIANDSREGHWNVLARLTLRDELDFAQRALTISILSSKNKNLSSEELIENWAEKNTLALSKWDDFLAEMHASNSVEYTLFFIAIRELISLLISSEERAAFMS